MRKLYSVKLVSEKTGVSMRALNTQVSEAIARGDYSLGEQHGVEYFTFADDSLIEPKAEVVDAELSEIKKRLAKKELECQEWDVNARINTNAAAAKEALERSRKADLNLSEWKTLADALKAFEAQKKEWLDAIAAKQAELAAREKELDETPATGNSDSFNEPVRTPDFESDKKEKFERGNTHAYYDVFSKLCYKAMQQAGKNDQLIDRIDIIVKPTSATKDSMQLAVYVFGSEGQSPKELLGGEET